MLITERGALRSTVLRYTISTVELLAELNQFLLAQNLVTKSLCESEGKCLLITCRTAPAG